MDYWEEDLNTAQSMLDKAKNDITEARKLLNSKIESISAKYNLQFPIYYQELKVHIIDVGQADCIFVQAPEKNMLIDAGNDADSNLIISYLKNLGISKIDIVVGTHPHEDHIGSLDTVINTFDVGKIYMPKVSHNTKTFEDVLTAIKNKGLKVTTAIAGVSLDLGKGLTAKMLAPNSSKYNDLNDYSAVIKLAFGNTSFLFTGDAETVSEQEMLAKKNDLKADVLKIGHHGSSSSTSEAFLKAVSPKYAVICVGKDNSYGHPDNNTLYTLAKNKVEVLRTDLNGTIIITSDGKNIEIDKKISPIKNTGPPASDHTVVFVTKTGAKYHNDGCRYLTGSKIQINLRNAVDSGYSPCSVCNPPTADITNNADATNNIDTTNNIDRTNSRDNSANVSEGKVDQTVYVTKTGNKYHSSGCSYLSKSCIPMELSKAKNSGYTPCSRCNPPR